MDKPKIQDDETRYWYIWHHFQLDALLIKIKNLHSFQMNPTSDNYYLDRKEVIKIIEETKGE